MTCFWFEVLHHLIPFAGLRARLCGWHVGRCPRCRLESGGGDALAPLLVTARQVSPGLDLWPGIRERIASPAAPLVRRRPRRWAYAVAMAAALVVTGLGTLLVIRPHGSSPARLAVRPVMRTRLCSASIENRPARIFLIQSRNPDRAIFWIAKNDKRS